MPGSPPQELGESFSTHDGCWVSGAGVAGLHTLWLAAICTPVQIFGARQQPHCKAGGQTAISALGAVCSAPWAGSPYLAGWGLWVSSGAGYGSHSALGVSTCIELLSAFHVRLDVPLRNGSSPFHLPSTEGYGPAALSCGWVARLLQHAVVAAPAILLLMARYAVTCLLCWCCLTDLLKRGMTGRSATIARDRPCQHILEAATLF